MSLETRITSLATTIAAEVNQINTNAGALASLTTTNKASLVAALNELKAALDAIDAAAINDASSSSTTETWSINKISLEISNAVDAIIDGAPGALDTLNEIAAALQDDAGTVTDILSAQAKRVAVDQVQSFTGPEQSQARTNIGAVGTADAGDTDRDFASDFTGALT